MDEHNYIRHQVREGAPSPPGVNVDASSVQILVPHERERSAHEERHDDIGEAIASNDEASSEANSPGNGLAFGSKDSEV